ncbi:MAG: hypothetical protein KGJ06_10020 [Pseudomonadota bacterium]|nr:hypothetical protein [Pseudomonadota bacterium]
MEKLKYASKITSHDVLAEKARAWLSKRLRHPALMSLDNIEVRYSFDKKGLRLEMPVEALSGAFLESGALRDSSPLLRALEPKSELALREVERQVGMIIKQGRPLGTWFEEDVSARESSYKAVIHIPVAAIDADKMTVAAEEKRAAAIRAAQKETAEAALQEMAQPMPQQEEWTRRDLNLRTERMKIILEQERTIEKARSLSRDR